MSLTLFPMGTLCVEWGMSSMLLQFITEIAFTSYLCRTSRLALVRDQGSVRSFLDICTAFHICMAFYSLRNMSEIVKAPYRHLSPQIFLLSFLSSFLIAPTGIAASGNYNVKQLPLIFGTNSLEA